MSFSWIAFPTLPRKPRHAEGILVLIVTGRGAVVLRRHNFRVNMCDEDTGTLGATVIGLSPL